jgi:hypothetical protein
MPRLITANCRAAMNERASFWEMAFDITLKDATVLNWATAQITVSKENQAGVSANVSPAISYEPRILEVPEITFSIGKQPDGGTVVVENLDYQFSQSLVSASKPFENASVNVYVCYPLAGEPPGTYERDLFFVGKLRENPADSVEGRLLLISDLQDRTPQVGNHELTQRCLNQLGDAICGRANLPVGATCSKIFDDAVNGCAAWDNQHRFNGIDKLIEQVVNSSSGWEEPYGGHIGGGQCIDPHSFVLTTQGMVQAGVLKFGDYVLDDFGRAIRVINVKRVWASERYNVRDRHGNNLICSATHPLKITAADAYGRAAAETCRDVRTMLSKSQNDNRILSVSFSATPDSSSAAPATPDSSSSAFAPFFCSSTAVAPSFSWPSMIAKKRMCAVEIVPAIAGWVIEISLEPQSSHIYLAGGCSQAADGRAEDAGAVAADAYQWPTAPGPPGQQQQQRWPRCFFASHNIKPLE